MHQRKDRGQQQQSDGHEHTNEVALPILLTSAGDVMQRTNVKRRLDSTGFEQTEGVPYENAVFIWNTMINHPMFRQIQLQEFDGS